MSRSYLVFHDPWWVVLGVQLQAVVPKQNYGAGYIGSASRIYLTTAWRCMHLRQYLQEQSASPAPDYTLFCTMWATQMTSGVVSCWYFISYIFTWCLAPSKDASRWHARSCEAASHLRWEGGLQMAVSRRSRHSLGVAPSNGRSEDEGDLVDDVLSNLRATLNYAC